MGGLTYEVLQREARKQLLRYALLRGQGGPLLFLWVAGSGFFLITWNAPAFAALWTAASALFALPIARDCLRSPRVAAVLNQSFLEKRYPATQLGNRRHQAAITKAIQLFGEVLQKLAEIKGSRGLDEDLLQTVSDMDQLLALQYESAKQVEELERVLALITSNAELPGGPATAGAASPGHPEAQGVTLRERNVAAVRHEVAAAEALVDVIAQRLETVLLQVFQMEKQAIDLVTAAEAREASANALERLQQTVDARRSAADQLLDLLAPEGPGTVRQAT